MMTPSDMANQLFDEHMADSVIVIMTRSDRKSGRTEKWVSTVGNTYACSASAQEWLDEVTAIAQSNSIDRALEDGDSETPK